MAKKQPSAYPLRLDEDLKKQVKASAKERKWALSVWFQEAVKLMLKAEQEAK